MTPEPLGPTNELVTEADRMTFGLVTSRDAWQETGLLWAINRVLLHPRGFSLVLGTGEDGGVRNMLLKGDGTECLSFDSDEPEHARFEAFLSSFRPGGHNRALMDEAAKRPILTVIKEAGIDVEVDPDHDDRTVDLVESGTGRVLHTITVDSYADDAHNVTAWPVFGHCGHGCDASAADADCPVHGIAPT